MTDFADRVAVHMPLLRKRGVAMAAEHMPPQGQAALWYGDVIGSVPRSGREVAKQLARLCGEDSRVRIPWRSLADAVGRPDKAGRPRAYTERGAQALVEGGWLRVETTGKGCASRTTFYLVPGQHLDYESWWLDGDNSEESAA